MRKISMKRKSKSGANEEVETSEENGQEYDETDQKKKSPKKSKKGRKTNDAEPNGTEENTAGSSNEDIENDEEDSASTTHSKKKGSKKGKKGRKSNNASEANGTENEEEDTQYEVETVLDQKTVKGVKQYLIRWKGYGAESDTWEPESTLSCPELIEKFLNSQKSPAKGKKRGSQGNSKKSPKKAKEDSDDEEDEAEAGGEYEVDKIIEVHHKKNGKREFLVHWKGYTNKDNTWEPEENMNCPDLIERFMAKVDKAKETNARELRVDRKPTNMFTLSMSAKGRRLSRRNLGKQRAQYKETE